VRANTYRQIIVIKDEETESQRQKEVEERQLEKKRKQKEKEVLDGRQKKIRHEKKG
jgi:hypothetical protein